MTILEIGISFPTVETQKEGNGDPFTTDHRYDSHVTLYLDDKERMKSGWSTRKEHGAPLDKPFAFQPEVNLIQGWTTGMLQMKERQISFSTCSRCLGIWRESNGLTKWRWFLYPCKF
jgi:hypothetical protein